MCSTYLSGVGDCVDLSRDGDFCDERDEMKGDRAACTPASQNLKTESNELSKGTRTVFASIDGATFAISHKGIHTS